MKLMHLIGIEYKPYQKKYLKTQEEVERQIMIHTKHLEHQMEQEIIVIDKLVKFLIAETSISLMVGVILYNRDLKGVEEQEIKVQDFIQTKVQVEVYQTQLLKT